MKKFVPLSDAYGNKDPVARDIAMNYPFAMTRRTMQLVASALASRSHTFMGRLGMMVAPIFRQASSPTPHVRSSSSRAPELRIDT